MHSLKFPSGTFQLQRQSLLKVKRFSNLQGTQNKQDYTCSFLHFFHLKKNKRTRWRNGIESAKRKGKIYELNLRFINKAEYQIKLFHNSKLQKLFIKLTLHRISSEPRHSSTTGFADGASDKNKQIRLSELAA